MARGHLSPVMSPEMLLGWGSGSQAAAELGASPELELYLEENLKVPCNHERTGIKAVGPASDLIPDEASGYNPGLIPACSPASLCSWGADEKSEGPSLLVRSDF